MTIIDAEVSERRGLTWRIAFAWMKLVTRIVVRTFINVASFRVRRLTIVPYEYDGEITPPTFIYEPTADGGQYQVEIMTFVGLSFNVIRVPIAEKNAGGGGGLQPSSSDTWQLEIRGVTQAPQGNADPSGERWYVFSRFTDEDGINRRHRIDVGPFDVVQPGLTDGEISSTSSAGSDYVVPRANSAGQPVLIELSGGPGLIQTRYCHQYYVKNANGSTKYSVFLQQPFDPGP